MSPIYDEVPSPKLTPEAQGYVNHVTRQLANLGSQLAEVTRERDEARAEAAAMRVAISTLFSVIEHGDDKHRAWLKDAIVQHFSAAIQPDAGKALLEEMERLKSELLVTKATVRFHSRRTEIVEAKLTAAQAVVEAAQRFKKQFDKGFPNSLNAIQARDEIFDALAAHDQATARRSQAAGHEPSQEAPERPGPGSAGPS